MAERSEDGPSEASYAEQNEQVPSEASKCRAKRAVLSVARLAWRNEMSFGKVVLLVSCFHALDFPP